MAGDWIKITNDLPDKEEVHRISERLSIPPPHVVGLLVKFWAWCDRNLENGCASVAPMFASRYVGEPHFHEALIEVGWMKPLSQGGFELPNFDRHISKSAKSRALSAIRMEKSRYDSSVTKSQPEKRRTREEKNISYTKGEISADSSCSGSSVFAFVTACSTLVGRNGSSRHPIDSPQGLADRTVIDRWRDDLSRLDEEAVRHATELAKKAQSRSKPMAWLTSELKRQVFK